MREPLQTPPKLRPDTLRITPLGGLGDVGRNSASFEINGQRSARYREKEGTANTG